MCEVALYFRLEVSFLLTPDSFCGQEDPKSVNIMMNRVNNNGKDGQIDDNLLI